MTDGLKTHVCPECGSGKVEISGSIITDTALAKCSACGWEGTKEKLISAFVPNLPGDLSQDAALSIAQEVSDLYMKLLAQYAGHQIGLAIVQSGIVGVHDKDSLTRLLRAACIGAHKATLEEVESMQARLQDERSTN